jgi:hypothetical protein
VWCCFCPLFYTQPQPLKKPPKNVPRETTPPEAHRTPPDYNRLTSFNFKKHLPQTENKQLLRYERTILAKSVY